MPAGDRAEQRRRRPPPPRWRRRAARPPGGGRCDPCRSSSRKPAYAIDVPSPNRTPSAGVVAVGVRRRRRPEISTTPTSTTGTAATSRRARSLAEQPPGEEADDDHLQVAQHGRDAGADGRDGVVPEHQVDREEDAGAAASQRSRARPAAVPAVLAQHQQAQHRQRVEAAEGGGGGGLDVGEPDQGGRAGDARGAGGCGEDRPVGERHAHTSPRIGLEPASGASTVTLLTQSAP